MKWPTLRSKDRALHPPFLRRHPLKNHLPRSRNQNADGISAPSWTKPLCRPVIRMRTPKPNRWMLQSVFWKNFNYLGTIYRFSSIFNFVTYFICFFSYSSIFVSFFPLFLILHCLFSYFWLFGILQGSQRILKTENATKIYSCFEKIGNFSFVLQIFFKNRNF